MAIDRLPTAGADSAGATDALRDPAANALRARASADPSSVVKTAAKQFEAIFMQQLMKSMRESTMASGMLDNAGTQMGTEMLDTQFANQLSGMPGGLADVIARQLERQMAGTPPAATGGAATGSGKGAAAEGADRHGVGGAGVPVRPARTVQAAAQAAAAAGAPAATARPSQQEFLSRHQRAASAAEAESGIPATFMVAQAAHESGWGRHEIKHADGSPSFNLFGIKAGAGWSGKVAQVRTTEVVDGQPRKVMAKFRAYASYEESFRDYAQLMKANPRYAGVVTAAAGHSAQGFAQGLQRAGYATDPAYADKLTRVINTTLRLQRATLSTPQTLA
jgi:peptidoglycan hydrolase FlgJ